MPNKVQIQFIKDALDQPEVLSDWEYDFINSIAELEPEDELSEKQNRVLNRISQKFS